MVQQIWATRPLPRASLLVLVVLLAAVGCRSARPPSEPPSEVAPPPSAGPIAPRPPADIDGWIDYLTIEEKVGQLLWFGLPAGSVSHEAEQLLRAGTVGGFVFFARQGREAVAIQRLAEQLQALARSRERFTPGLILSVDHEGGEVQRFPEAMTTWPGAMAVGATRSEAYAEQVGKAMARELRAIGINMNLAPVADVNSNPANPVIGVRSFGEDPQLVSRLVVASVKGLQSEPLSAVVKHFPGHGDTHLDSHMALPTISHGWERLNDVELAPFRAAVAAGVDAIMTAHVIFPAVAADKLPATLSWDVLHGLLRDRLKYSGLVVTDAIDTMKAISDHYGLEHGMMLSLQAGADALLITESFGRQADLHKVIVKAVESGAIPQSRLDEAVRRHLTLKARLGLLPGLGAPQAPPPLSEVGREAHQRLANQVGAKALTLVRNRHLPIKPSADQAVLVIGPEYAARVTGTDGILTALGAGIRAEHPNVTELTLDRRPSAVNRMALQEAASAAAVVVYGVASGHAYPEHKAILADLIATEKPVIVVGMGEPYELLALPQIQTYVAAYGFQTSNLQGVGALLFGRAPPTGKLPVAIPGLYSVGHGLSY